MKTRMTVIGLLLMAGAGFAASTVYNDLGKKQGEKNAFWDTTPHGGVTVWQAAPKSLPSLDIWPGTCGWQEDGCALESRFFTSLSSLGIGLKTIPPVGFLLFLH